MGMVYYVSEEQLSEIPRLHDQGPDVLDEYSFDEFERRLRRFHGEIKGVLTRGRVISGIGNAWSDEILFAAKIYPFKRRKALSDDELRRLYAQSRQVISDAIPVVRESIGDNIHLKARDFLQVHNRGGQPCPRCGNTISQITANKRITSYCGAASRVCCCGTDTLSAARPDRCPAGTYYATTRGILISSGVSPPWWETIGWTSSPSSAR